MIANGPCLRAFKIALCFSASALCNPAVAQETVETTEADTTDDIVVTAQFRSQNLQDTPIAITAISAEGMEARSMTQVTDITNSAPNVVLKPAGGAFGPAAQIFIRGIGQADSNFALEPGVGTYIDDVYYGSMYGANFDLLDLDRVEILRGPQGTLSGKNSIGGSLKLFTRKPDGNGQSFVEATYGARNLINFRGAADLTLVQDKLFARISGVALNQDGYQTRYDYGCLYPGRGVAAVAANQNCVLGKAGGKSYVAGRAALRWIATDNLEVDLSGSLLRDRSELPANVLTANNAQGAVFFNGINPALFFTDPGDRIGYSTYITNAFTDPAIYAGRPGAGTHPAIAAPDKNDLTSWNVAGTVDWTIADRIALKSITGYNSTRAQYGVDVDATPANFTQSEFLARTRQFTQELRLSGEAFDLLEWTIGGYYFEAHNQIDGVNFIFAGRPFENLNAPSDDIDSKNKSVFAHGIWELSNALNVTTGIRYTEDEKTYVYRRLNPFVPGTPTYTPAGPLTGTVGEYNDSRWDYRLNVDYRWSGDFMTYAQVSTGFRGGGVNPRPFVPEQAVPFAPETLTAFELGFKSDLFDRHLRVNGSVFLNKFKDLILTNTAPTPNSLNNATPTNAGSADVKGVEMEVSARPIDGLLIDLSGSYIDFQLKSLGALANSLPGITLNNNAPFMPEWKLSAGIQYAIDVPGIGTITPRLDYAYQSSFFTNIDNNPLGVTPGYSLLNGRVSWDSVDKDWRISVAVKNLADKVYYYQRFFVTGVQTGQPAPPREWSLTVRRTF